LVWDLIILTDLFKWSTSAEFWPVIPVIVM
jgi:hypothetical protein